MTDTIRMSQVNPGSSEQFISPMINVAQQGIKSTDDRATTNASDFGFCSYFLIGMSYFLTILFFPIAVCTNFKASFSVFEGQIFLDCSRIRKSSYFSSW